MPLNALPLLVVLLALSAGLVSGQDSVPNPEFSDPDLMQRLDEEAGPLVPTVKKLDPTWVKHLGDRGEPTVYSGEALGRIGMPVGGISCGQLNLSGDGRLWRWDLFNQSVVTFWDHYVTPEKPDYSIEQGFAVRLKVGDGYQVHALDSTGFATVTFQGEYPIGHVEFADPGLPLTVSLEGFSPFIPLNADDSSLPVTVMRYTLRNTGTAPLSVDLGGWLQNKTSCIEGAQFPDSHFDTVHKDSHLAFIESSCGPSPEVPGAAQRPDVDFAEFEGDSYSPWTVEGTAFGTKPAHGAPNPGQTLRGYLGEGVANSWNGSDESTGKLTSPDFTIARRRISFLIGGGKHPGQTCINLIVNGQVVRTATGTDSDVMVPSYWDVADLAGRSGHLEIVDSQSGGWGHIEIDHIVFRDATPEADVDLTKLSDYGTMGLGLIAPQPGDRLLPDLPDVHRIFTAEVPSGASAARPLSEKMTSGLVRTLTLAPGASQTVSFLIAWNFPNQRNPGPGRYYASRFPTALAVAQYVGANYDRLYGDTRSWCDTWYEQSTLPHWLLERTLANASTLATLTFNRFANGQVWGFEGVGNCDGSCTHVYSYEQTIGRLFPELDINLREKTDYNFALQSDGEIANRGTHERAAVDGQAGTILRTYRDHEVSPDDAFLKRNWPNIRRAEQWLIDQDDNGDGILKHNQRNTLDNEWFGEVAWLSGYYLASLHAAEAMALEVGDQEFASRCHAIYTVGSAHLVKDLYNGEYFQDRLDPAHLDSINPGSGCEIDQVLGQGWAFQVGLGRVLPVTQTRSALAALFRYNFTTDCGIYRRANPPGRMYAGDHEAGLVMCTFPKSDWNYLKAAAKGGASEAGYFNECMSGFEHQLASHMIWEGMVVEGLVVERAIHDRYAANKRDPYNEIECGDHYARAMASYGVFLAACGFSYHGPHAAIGFAPRLSPEHFKAAFTAAQGWGSYSQAITGSTMSASISLAYGTLRLKTIALGLRKGLAPTRAIVTLAGQTVASTVAVTDGTATITLASALVIPTGEHLDIALR